MWILGSAAVVMVLLTACLAEGAGPDRPKEHPKAAAPAAPWSVVFSDGSGNGLRIWKASKRERVRFDFSPVQPENSSTGLYSGGQPKKGLVDAQNARELWSRLRAVEADRALRVESRGKGTGAFRLKDPSGGEREFLIQDGPLLREFVSWLRAQVVGPESYNPTPRKKTEE